MKLITYRHSGRECVGVLTPEGIHPQPYATMQALIEQGGPQPICAQTGLVPLEEAVLLAPIQPRQDVICLGVNYAEHAAESAQFRGETYEAKKEPAVYFAKRVNEAVAPGGLIDSHPGLVQQLDYEAELAVIIGKAAKNVKAADAADFIFGYTIMNDVSARVLQRAHKQWFFGKSLDGFTPLGPVIVTADEIAFPPKLAIRSRVNGELRQNSSTELLITGIAQIIEELSSGMTLLPGTIISTGTPAGVGLGFNPPKFLKTGDTVECEIEQIGVLRNTVG